MPRLILSCQQAKYNMAISMKATVESAHPYHLLRFVVLRPSEQLWSCRDGQIVYHVFFTGQA